MPSASSRLFSSFFSGLFGLSGVLAGADGLLAQVTAARDNGGQNWSASVMLYDAEGGGIASWSDAVDEAMELAKRMKAPFRRFRH